MTIFNSHSTFTHFCPKDYRHKPDDVLVREHYPCVLHGVYLSIEKCIVIAKDNEKTFFLSFCTLILGEVDFEAGPIQ